MDCSWAKSPLLAHRTALKMSECLSDFVDISIPDLLRSRLADGVACVLDGVIITISSHFHMMRPVRLSCVDCSLALPGHQHP